jgi:nicotinate-nucleotide--dimethylbenzimidazole phosphoribosyltransferase
MRLDIRPVNREMYRKCEEKWLTIAKPLYSLGELERLINQIGAIREDISAPVAKRCAIIMCADNGVVCEGISQTDETVTAIVADNLAKGCANLNILTKGIGLDIRPVNIGMKYEPSSAGVVSACIRRGTGNIRKEAAMTRKEAERAIEEGIRQVELAVREGYDLITTGEMGIGNTTTSSACASVLLNAPVKAVTGKGAGLSDEGLCHKIEVIEEAVRLHAPDAHDPIDILSKVGGLDIAGMTGLFLGGGIYHVPVMIDGFISSVAALLAVGFAPNVRDYMIASHVSREPAGNMIMERLGLHPVIHADMALGEGTGAACLLPLLDMAHQVYSQNVTFEQIHMEAYQKL